MTLLRILMKFETRWKPTHRINLAIRPTPFHKIRIDTISLILSRDDLTGSTLSGNKIRKLEFLLADAKKRNFKSVVTVGGLQSNHCRATVVAAR